MQIANKMKTLFSCIIICMLTLISLHSGAAEHEEAAQQVKLWEADRSVLFDSLRAFVQTSGIKPEADFVTLVDPGNHSPIFAKVPMGWNTLGIDENDKGRVIYQDKDGFRLLITLEPVKNIEDELIKHIRSGQRYGSIVVLDQLFPAKDREVVRVATCEKGKGDVAFTEYRYFESGKQTVRVEFRVFDSPSGKRTVTELLSYLRSNYGKYEAVCQQMETTVFGVK